MKARMSGVCRGDGKVYARVSLASIASNARLIAYGRLADATVPCGIYPLNESDDWALEVPILDAPKLDVVVEQLDEHDSVLDTCTLRIDYARAKWASRLNYRLHPVRCAQLRDCEQRFTLGHYQLRILHRYEGDGGVVWRFQVVWEGDSSAQPTIQVRNGRGCTLDAKPLVFEEQLAEHGDNVIFYSLALPESQRFFLIEASDPSNRIASGFCSANPAFCDACENATRQYMRSASDDDVAYRHWLKHHQAGSEELAAQRATSFDYAPLISVVIACAQKESSELQRTIESVQAQTYDNWELVLAEGARGDEHPDSAPHASIEAVKGNYVALLDEGDLLEPDALHCYVRMINDALAAEPDTELGRAVRNPLFAYDNANAALTDVQHVDLLFCDEDSFERPEEYGQPLFKTRLNLDMLYSHDCVGGFLVLRRSCIEKMELSPSETRAALRYDLVLRTLEQGGKVAHVPRVLFHKRKRTVRESNALRAVLQAHFDRRGIAGTVGDGELLGTPRMRYALPDPAPLVSVVIPNKDHIEELDACVRSLLERATYPNIEIVIVENNSEIQATFDYYDQLVSQHANVNVVRWPGDFNFPAIVNFGVKNAQGDHLLILNNDTEVMTPDFMEEMVGLLQRPEMGVVGAKLFFKDGLVQHAGMIVGVRGAVAHANQDFSDKRAGYRCTAVLPGNFSSVTGACQMVRRDVFEQVGGYDESLAVGFNDADFCLRVYEAGYLVTYAPYAKLHHYEFTSRGREVADPTKLARWERERDCFANRWKDVFESGDPFLNPNLDKNSAYYALPEN